jgi:hypothetical protein
VAYVLELKKLKSKSQKKNHKIILKNYCFLKKLNSLDRDKGNEPLNGSVILVNQKL